MKRHLKFFCSFFNRTFIMSNNTQAGRSIWCKSENVGGLETVKRSGGSISNVTVITIKVCPILQYLHKIDYWGQITLPLESLINQRASDHKLYKNRVQFNIPLW